MGKYLVITEKPSAAKALKDGLGASRFRFVSCAKGGKRGNGATPGYYDSDFVTIVPVAGHLMSLYDVEDYIYGVDAKLTPEQKRWSNVQLPFIPENGFKKKVTKSASGFYEQQYEVVKKLLKSDAYDCIVNYGDPDNEGELLIREVIESVGCTKPIKRLFNNSLVPSVVANEFLHNLKNDSEFNHMYFQALARQQTDWLLGINLTRYLTLKSAENAENGRTLWRVGRVIVPLVKYIYDRDMEIANFSSKKGYGINAVITKGEYEHTFSSSDPKIYFEEADKGQCEQLCANLSSQPMIVTDVKKSAFKIKPHKLMSLTDFRSEMNKKFGYSVEDSSKVAQSLYEAGYITYPRTNSQYLSTKEMDNVKSVINILNGKYPNLNLAFHDSKSVFDDNKTSEEGHTALTLTTKIPSDDELKSMSEPMRNGYRLIMARFFTNFSENPIIAETVVTMECGGYKFKVTGNEIVKKGFLVYETRKLSEPVPEFTVGEKVDTTFSVVERETKPPQPVSVAELLEFSSNPYKKELKAANPNDDSEYYRLLKEGVTIGTQATLDTIIGNAIKEKYITANKKNYRIADKGIALIKLLDELGVNLYKERNIEMNKAIRQVGMRNISLSDNVSNIKAELTDIIDATRNVTVSVEKFGAICTCPLCGGNVYYSPKIKVFSCENTKKDCVFGIFENNKFMEKWGISVNKTSVTGFAKNMYIVRTVKPKSGSKSSAPYKIKIKIDGFQGKNNPKFSVEYPKSG